MATSIDQALLIAQPEQNEWYRHSGVVLLRSMTFPRACFAGDVLVADNRNEGRQTWMIEAGRWTTLPSPPAEHPVQQHAQQEEILSVAWSPEGNRFAACGGQGLVDVYTLGSSYHPTYETHAGMARAVAWSPDGARIATGDGNDATHIWDVLEDTSTHHIAHAACGRILICQEREQTTSFKGVYALAWSPNNLRVAAGNHLGIVRIWHAETGRCEAQYQQSRDVVRALAWSPNGRMLAGVSADSMLQIWNRDYYRIEYILRDDVLNEMPALAWSPDGKDLLLGGSDSNVLHLYEALTGRFVKAIALSRYAGVMGILSVAYAPNGRHVVAGCTDGTVQIVDVAEAQHVHTYYHGHSGRVNTVAWSPVGNRIASGGEDTWVRIWNVHSAVIATPDPTATDGHRG